MNKNITTPLTKEKVKDLKAGDMVYLSGTIYTGRDAAHKKMVETLNRNEEIPFSIENEILYYVGPTPKKENEVIGACGPTTSYRMDDYSPFLLDKGNTGMIGKGMRNEKVIESMKKNTAVYFGALGGCAALISKCVTSCEVIAYEELGTEAVHKLEVKDFPLIVIIDSEGNNLYDIGKKQYKK